MELEEQIYQCSITEHAGETQKEELQKIIDSKDGIYEKLRDTHAEELQDKQREVDIGGEELLDLEDTVKRQKEFIKNLNLELNDVKSKLQQLEGASLTIGEKDLEIDDLTKSSEENTSKISDLEN